MNDWKVLRLPAIQGAAAALSVGLLGPGCATKEAQDPKDILGDDESHEGAYGGGDQSDTPPESEHKESSAKGTGQAAAGKQGASPNAAASEAECRTAARHLVELGIDLVIAEETDLAKKKKLLSEKRQAMDSAASRQHVDQWTRECLANGTSRSEAQCIARVRSESDIDRCVGE